MIDDQLFIQLYPDNEQEITWLRRGKGEGASIPRTGRLADLSEQAADCRVIVFAPAGDVVLLMADVPPMSRQRMSMAIPFALEDDLITDIDSLHFAFAKRSEGEFTPVAVVADDLMSTWLSRLQQANIQPDILIPETLALPLIPDGWSILIDTQGGLVRSGVLSGFAMEPSNLATIVQGALDREEEFPRQIHVLHRAGEGASGISLLKSLCCEVTEESPSDRLQILGAHFDEKRVINLLQGKYSRESGIKQIWRAWRIPLALAMIWFSVWIAGTLFDMARLSEQSRMLDNEIQTAYREVFPEARNMQNLRIRMQRDLDRSRNTGARKTIGFLDILGGIGVHLGSEPNIQLTNIHFRSGKLELRMEIDDLQAFDKIKARLDRADLAVEVLSVTSRGNTVTAHIKISPEISPNKRHSENPAEK
uniref:Type II secretion system protein L n=1 Tax=Candidatus Kentrum sp. SD TaxID=2126332 RepID=A0A450YQ59_9GAMM|nr:MAG: general secretion pathway protein L [Candidatus Kentron sp. SD]VFK43678.1 MAG: general secretion pathway protein L [Candidatus Kentron sp. SD]VFK79254.1 MAG: general secretion pathway protein L [Candidatus Kentron sp. SD]